MKKMYSKISMLFAILSIIPFILIQLDLGHIAPLITLGQDRVVGLVIPIVYSFIGLIFALLSKRGDLKRNLIFINVIFFLLNIVIVYIGLFAFRTP
ncbi:hypothetical protein BAMA_16635 [Bacillus manliponensis]|uniref:Uncharacterized protein n=1 Tax=Bacillus manliponensis TaxID=574376 RepID=A0A073K0V7_9BACI|nr:hypothetical protein [Bacillus manliponensis]KEK20082.1 hypothetical protein BAMA_16635 [Bacillus manliponensis]